MNILIVNMLYPPDGIGGAERSTRYLAQGLVERGHRVSIVCQALCEEDSQESIDGVSVFRRGAPPGFQPNVYALPREELDAKKQANRSQRIPFARQLRPILEQEQPHVVVCGVTPEARDVWSLCRKNDVPTVQILRSYSNICNSRMYHGGYVNHAYEADCAKRHEGRRESSHQVAALVGVSRHMLDVHLNARFFSNASVLRVIPNSFETDRVTPLPTLANTGERLVTFGFLGRLHETKGCEAILQAFLQQHEKYPHTRLKLAGTGNSDYVGRLKQTYQSDAIEFLGYVEPGEFFDQVDVVCVLSTWEEPFGRVNMEALHFGRPVLGSRRGGIPEIITHGVNGWLTEPLSLSELTASMSHIAQLSTKEWAALHEACLAAAAQYSVGAVAEKYEEVIGATLRAKYSLAGQ